MTKYRTLLEQVVTLGYNYNLDGSQLRTVYKILESLRGIR